MRSSQTQCNLCLRLLHVMVKSASAGLPEVTNGLSVTVMPDMKPGQTLVKLHQDDLPNADAHLCYDCVRGLKAALVSPVEVTT
jgi:PP-loop superfamily ATP-utilizing enzyme